MEILNDLLKILLPSAILLYAMFLTVKSFLNNEIEKKKVDVEIKNNEISLPVRLQAYERICLLLERISPHQLILRLNNNELSAFQFQQLMVFEIREEFNHNLSQQVYMSNEVWNLVKSAVEETIALINQSGQSLNENASSLDLAKRIFDQLLDKEMDATQRALLELKAEIRKLF